MDWNLSVRGEISFVIVFFYIPILIGIASYIIHTFILGGMFAKNGGESWHALVPVYKTYKMINAAFEHKRAIRIIATIAYIPVIAQSLLLLITFISNSDTLSEFCYCTVFPFNILEIISIWRYIESGFDIWWIMSMLIALLPILCDVFFSIVCLIISYRFIGKYSKINNKLIFILLLIPLLAIIGTVWTYQIM